MKPFNNAKSFYKAVQSESWDAFVEQMIFDTHLKEKNSGFPIKNKWDVNVLTEFYGHRSN